MRKRTSIVGLAVLTLIAGCTVHPVGEREERQAALAAGSNYASPAQRRPISPMPATPTVDDLVQYALLTNADLERAYWDWRSALEQVPIDGTEPTNLAITGSVGVTRGRTSPGQTLLGPGTDPMTDIVLPNKLSASARRALELARAAGQRFRQSRNDLRAKVIGAYDDYALTAEIARLDQQNATLLTTVEMVTEARNRAGDAAQQDVLKAENELDLARNDIAADQARLQVQRAALNAMLDRAPGAPLPVPGSLPKRQFLPPAIVELSARIEKQNPQLASLSDETRSRSIDIELARLEAEPDITLGGSTDLEGIAQSFAAVVTVPVLKYDAIRAAVAQAEDNLRGAESVRRQTGHDLQTQAAEDLVTIQDTDRQNQLYAQTILPRARQAVDLSRSAYETGNASLLDVLDGERSLLLIERVAAELDVTRDKRLADLETLIATQ